MNLTERLGLENGAIAAVTGCGGKTTLIRLLATQNREKKVLISPTTRIMPMKEPGIVLCDTLEKCIPYHPRQGIQCLGIHNPATGKLGTLPDKLLRQMTAACDLSLLEADGSRGLPCKGWHSTEPVIPSFCTHTIGIVTLQALGKQTNSQSVLFLPEFSRLTGLGEGEIITLENLADMVCGKKGMFWNSIGRRCLIVNQVEKEEDHLPAQRLLELISQRTSVQFDCLMYGSALKNIWYDEKGDQ